MTGRPEAPREPRPFQLADFLTEKMLDRHDPRWPRIGVWQRQGFVRLRWNETAAFAWVRLTEAGRAEMAAAEPELGPDSMRAYAAKLIRGER